MAEYINLDTPLELYRLRGNYYERFSTTLRELFVFNKIPYTAADVREVKHGHWITQEESDKAGCWNLIADTCSVCGHCDWDNTESRDFNFCPNCGADMREES